MGNIKTGTTRPMTTPDNRSSVGPVGGEQSIDRFEALSDEYLRAHLEDLEFRQDIIAVHVFDKGNSEMVRQAMKLFWEVTQPSLFRSGKLVESQEILSLPTELEQALLEKLAEYERDCRVEYLPDEDSFSLLSDREVYIYIAAARAIRLKLRDGYSDETTQGLESAFKTATQYQRAPPSVYDYEEASICSLYAAVGLVLKELFRVYKLDGKYEKALRCLALAIRYLGCALSSVLYLAEEEIDTHERFQAYHLRVRLSPYTLIEDLENMSIKGRPGLRPPIFDVDPLEAVEAFKLLQESSKDQVDWKQVASDCETLGNHWGVCLGYEDFVRNETVTEDGGSERVWLQLWTLNQGRALERLDRDELSDYLRDTARQEADVQAERRLRTYFIKEGNWNLIPDRAKESMVSADREWFSSGRSRSESVFNELRVATETLCYDFFWQPLRRSTGKANLLQFARRDRELKQSGYDPSATKNYLWLLRQPFFDEYIAKANLSHDDLNFVKKDLPSALTRLRNLRNPAEHVATRVWTRAETEGYLKEFLGVGCAGILPRLVEIGAKLKGAKPA